MPVAHAVPQAPQWLLDVWRFVSQPSEYVPLQSPKLVLHEATRHAPDEHAGTPLATVQTVPHAPQFETSAPMLTSQPLAALRSQSAKPALQVKPQVPEAQVDVALARAGQTVPHEPQLFGSVAVLVHEPEQLMSPVAQVTTHAPAEHTWPEAQRTPHMPQLLLSTRRSRHVPEQFVCPVGHTSVQTLDTQLCPVAQTRPHAPQLFTSLVRSRQLVPHAVRPVAQLVTHAEPMQICPEGQTVPHVPQLLRSLVVSTQVEPHAV